MTKIEVNGSVETAGIQWTLAQGSERLKQSEFSNTFLELSNFHSSAPGYLHSVIQILNCPVSIKCLLLDQSLIAKNALVTKHICDRRSATIDTSIGMIYTTQEMSFSNSIDKYK